MKTKAIAILLAACLLASVQGCSRANGEPKVKEGEAEVRVPVEAAVARRETILASFQGTAPLEPESQAQVVTKTSGVVLEILVEEGDAVKRGAVLARLDSDRQRLQRAQAEATLRKLENDYRRQKELHERKLIGQDVFERARFDLDVQRAAYANAELELSYTEIRAPISGVVSRRLVKVGNLVQLNQPLFEIDDFDPLQAVLSVPEREIQRLHAGQPVQMLVDALPGKVFHGIVQRVSPTVEAGTGTFRVTAAFRDPALRPGMFGRLNVVYDTRAEALVIPREALLAEGEEAAVYVVDEGSVRRAPLRLGHVANGVAEVLEGLEEGQQVVTLGQAAVRDGSKVQVITR